MAREHLCRARKYFIQNDEISLRREIGYAADAVSGVIRKGIPCSRDIKNMNNFNLGKVIALGAELEHLVYSEVRSFV